MEKSNFWSMFFALIHQASNLTVVIFSQNIR